MLFEVVRLNTHILLLMKSSFLRRIATLGWLPGKSSLLVFVGLSFANGVLGQNITAVSAGHWTSFYLRADGTVWAAGWNDSGQLGDGNSTGNGWDSVSAPTPVLIMTGASDVSASAAGFHTLFVKADGTAWATGDNRFGQLGDGSNQNEVSPVQVKAGGVPITGVKAVSAGSWHSLLLKNDGTVWAFGYNWTGQLGDGTNQDRNTAVQVKVNGVPLTGVKAIAAGSSHSLFLKTDGSVWAVGDNWSGQLGDGVEIYPDGNTHTSTPVQVMSDVKAIEGGQEHSLFLKPDGRVFAVGGNSSGQLGNGTTSDYFTPVRIPVQTQTGIVAISARGSHSLFLKTDGTVWGCGENWEGELGDGTTVSPRPSLVKMRSHGAGITAIGAGLRHSIYVQGGLAWATGSNLFFGLGDGTNESRTYPQPSFAVARHHRFVPGPNAGNGSFSLRTEIDGTAWGMGSGYGVVPSQIPGLERTLSISPGLWRSTGAQTVRRAALDETGNIWTWNTTLNPSPSIVPGIGKMTAMFDGLGSGTLFGIQQKSRTVWSLTSLNEQTPIFAQRIENEDARPISAEQVAHGGSSFLALDMYGTVWSWGYNHSGQLGDGTLVDRTFAAPVLDYHEAPIQDAICVASAGSSSYAVRSDGTVWAWGGGMFGDGPARSLLYAEPIPGLTDAVAIYSSWGNRYLLRRDGRVVAWGSNSFGALGINSTASPILYPAFVKMSLNGTITDLTRVVEVSTNGSWTFFRREDGSVYACGMNNVGQIGGGVTPNKIVATLVAEY